MVLEPVHIVAVEALKDIGAIVGLLTVTVMLFVAVQPLDDTDSVYDVVVVGVVEPGDRELDVYPTGLDVHA